METYLLKFSACLAVFWLVYVLFLERQNMHKFKRFYLLGAVVLAIVIPNLTITEYVEPVIASIDATSIIIPTEYLEIAPIEEPSFLTLENALWLIYGIGILLFTIRFAVNFVKMQRRISDNENVLKHSFIYVLLKEDLIPHSFFRYIFFNKKRYQSENIPKEVLLHEETHAKQLHSLDIIILELLQIVFWFHPLIYILKHHIKLNHEFLADQAVLNQGSDAKVYQNILLQFSSNTHNHQLTSAINYSSIKKRFTVMKTQTSKTRIWLSTILVLPVIALLFFSFAEHIEVEREIENPQVSNSTLSAQNNNYFSQDQPIMVILINRNGELLVDDELGSLKSIETKLKTLTKSFDNSKAIFVKYDLTDASDKALKEVRTLIRAYNFKVIQVDASYDSIIPPAPPAPPKPIKSSHKGGPNLGESKSHHQKSGPIKINDATYYFIQDNGKTTYYDNNGSVVDINKIPPPPPVAANATTKQKAEMLKAQEAYNKVQKEKGNTNKDQITGFTEINGEKLYYVSKNGETTYFNRYGKIVNMDNLPPPPPTQSKNPSFLEYMEDMEKQGATFYLDDKKISVEKAKHIAKNNKGKRTEMLTQLDENGEYIVKLSSSKLLINTKVGKPLPNKKESILPIVNGKTIKSGIMTMTISEIKKLTLTLPEGEITAFKLKIPGIKTEQIKGNTITQITLKSLESAKLGDYITLFDIKDNKNSKFTPVAIEIVE